MSVLIGFIPPARPVTPEACLRHDGGRIRAHLGRSHALCQALDESDQDNGLPMPWAEEFWPIAGLEHVGFDRFHPARAACGPGMRPPAPSRQRRACGTTAGAFAPTSGDRMPSVRLWTSPIKRNTLL
jgi:hypothetical protein